MAILDLSIFCTDYLDCGPASLRERVVRRFRSGRSAYVAKLQNVLARDTDYQAHYVLTARPARRGAQCTASLTRRPIAQTNPANSIETRLMTVTSRAVDRQSNMEAEIVVCTRFRSPKQCIDRQARATSPGSC